MSPARTAKPPPPQCLRDYHARAGRRPNFLIGGLAEFWESYGLGGGNEFIIEGDEYDTAFFDKGPKFLHYHPDELIITSLEFDHADIYADLPAIELQFRRLVNLSSAPRTNRRLGRRSSAHRRDSARNRKKHFARWKLTDSTHAPYWIAGDIYTFDDCMEFRIGRRSRKWQNVSYAMCRQATMS